LGRSLDKAERLSAVAAGFVLLTAVAGPMLSRFSDRLTPKSKKGVT
jgi:hypothetical protein